jgi:hypothetical protein
LINSEKLNFSLKNISGSKISEQELALRSKAVFEVWTYVDVLNFIEKNFEEDFIKKELINIAKKYPHSGYPVFIKNIQQIVGTIIKNRSEVINCTHEKISKNKVEEKNIKDIKSELSIEEKIKLEMEQEEKLKANTDVEQTETPYGIKELEKEFE